MKSPTVVALLSLSAVTGHMSIAAAGITSLLASAIPATAVATAAVTTAVSTTLGTVTSNVSDLPTLVAFLAAGSAREATAVVGVVVAVSRSSRWAVTRNVSGQTTAV